MINVLGNSLDESIVSKGYDVAVGRLDDVSRDFYKNMSDVFPEIEIFIEGVNEKEINSSSVEFIKFLIENVESNEALINYLVSTGKALQDLRVREEYCLAAVDVICQSFKNVLGRKWTKSINSEWSSMLRSAAEILTASYGADNAELENSEADDEQEVSVNSAVLKLQHIQDISRSQELKNDMLLLINDNDEIVIDGSDVERIDGTALQLLCALFIYATGNSLTLSWNKPTESLIQSADMLGVRDLLKLI